MPIVEDDVLPVLRLAELSRGPCQILYLEYTCVSVMEVVHLLVDQSTGGSL